MNILFVTGHPAQIHCFRNLKFELERKGHNIYWLSTNKEISKYLLDYYKISYYPLRKSRNSSISRLLIFFKNIIVSVKYIKKNKIDLIFSRISPYMSISCFILRKTHLGMTDTESAWFYDKLFGRFLSVIFTAKSFKRQLRNDQIRFDGNIELFYLHPKRFIPLEKGDLAKLLGIETEISYIIMRFVSWDAYHDKGLTGFTYENKIKAAQEFSKYAHVFINSENELPPELESHRIIINPEKMHDVLANAKLFFGESATMASESAVLGTPAIFLNENWFGSTDEEEDHGLLFSFKESLDEQEKAIKKGVELLQINGVKELMEENRKHFLRDKIDVTAFMVWFIEAYPESAKIMKEDPDYQYRFR